MAKLAQFPCCIESWLLVWDLPSVEFDYIFNQIGGSYPPKPTWTPYFCICREDEAKFTFFSEEKDAYTASTPKHLHICRFNRNRPVCHAFPSANSFIDHWITVTFVFPIRITFRLFLSLYKF
nr:hypothetical transcript [Hymenolepis microstoma]